MFEVVEDTLTFVMVKGFLTQKLSIVCKICKHQTDRQIHVYHAYCPVCGKKHAEMRQACLNGEIEFKSTGKLVAPGTIVAEHESEREAATKYNEARRKRWLEQMEKLEAENAQRIREAEEHAAGVQAIQNKYPWLKGKPK